MLLAAHLAAGAAWALTPQDLPEVIALEEGVVARLQAPELSWSANGACLVVAGYSALHEPNVVVAPTDGRPVVAIPNLASPRVTAEPGSCRLACWQRAAPTPAGASRFVLSVFDPDLGVCSPLPGLAPFDAAPPVVWLTGPPRIVTLRARGGSTALVIYDPVAEKPVPLVVTVTGLGTVLRAADTPGRVVMGTVGLDGLSESYLIDLATGVASDVPDAERGGTAGRASPGSESGVAPTSGLVATCRADGLFLSAPGATEARRLLPRGALGAHPYSADGQPRWSPTEEHLAYTIPEAEGGLAEVRLVTLGLEEIVCEVLYAAGDSPPAPGATVWVCMELQRDEKGRATEPAWPTLKAQLNAISSPLATPEGQTIRARSIGLGAETLKRLTGLSEPPAEMADERNLRIGPAGAPLQTVLRSFTLPARQGLLAWSQGASVGQVRSVKVTRRALLLIGAPAPE